MTKKLSVNLLQAELLPPKALLTLNRVVLVWLATLVIMVVTTLIIEQQAKSLIKQQQKLQVTNTKYQQELQTLEVDYKAIRNSEHLSNRLEVLKMVMQNKKAFYQQLNDPSRTYTLGFSTAMNELSDLHHNDISLQRVLISKETLTFSGLARAPESVPTWLAGFESSPLLSGQSFIHFQLNENDAGITEFVISSETQVEEL